MTNISYASAFTAALLLSTAAPALAQDNIDEIIVTGSPLGRSIDEAITGVSILSGDELADRLAGTIGETLKTEPGVSSTFFGAGASRPIVRGQGGDRVRVLTNGIGSIDASSASPDHAVATEPAQAERIEVVRGAAILRFGSSGSGGVVNVMDGRIPDEMPDDGTDGAVRIGASSVDNGREVAASINQGIGSNLVLHLDGSWRKADNYRIPGEAESARLHALEGHDEDEEEETPDTGQLENSFAQSKSATAGLSYVGDRGYFGVAVHRFESDYGVPGGHEHEEVEEEGGEAEEEEAEEQVTIGLTQTRFDVNGAVDFDGFIERVQLFGGYADYAHTEFEAPGEPGTVFGNEGYEVRLEAIQREKNGWAAAYGGQIRHRDFSAIGEEAFVPPVKTDQYAAFTFQEAEIGDFHIEGAARFETTEHKNTAANISRSFDGISLSAGGDFHLTDTIRLGGTAYRTERAPTSEELFSGGPHLATNQFELGDPNLGIETATGIEAAFRHKSQDHFITVNAYYTDYDDYVFERETGASEDGLPVFQFSQSDASFKGFEIQAGHDLGTVSNFDMSVDVLGEYVRAKTDTGNLPRIPPLSVLAGIEAESERFKFRSEIDYAAKQNKLAAGEIPTDDFALVNLFATWKAPIDAQNVNLKLSVLNLFNSEARQHTSFLKDVVPLPGRNIRFAITASF